MIIMWNNDIVDTSSTQIGGQWAVTSDHGVDKRLTF